jgi:hypothetical protein
VLDKRSYVAATRAQHERRKPDIPQPKQAILRRKNALLDTNMPNLEPATTRSLKPSSRVERILDPKLDPVPNLATQPNPKTANLQALRNRGDRI